MAAFALAGLFISVFYVAPPLKLKHHGLGEPGVFVVWGPLMIGGTYYVTAGTLPPWVWVATLPYAHHRHHGADRQARRQVRAGLGARHPHAAGAARQADRRSA